MSLQVTTRHDTTRRLVHTTLQVVYKIHSNYSLLTDRYMCAVLCYIASTVLPMFPAPYFPTILCHTH
jgi:hypothetical protein